ncbi:MAG: HAD-IB family phosphatase [Thermoplasmatales archaeon]|nr:HAD-IB family phosphatase [Thermoplasmatales archaeon]
MGIKSQKYKLVMFDMDGTLIDGRSIFVFSEKKGFKDKLLRSLQSDKEPYEKSIEIAQFLHGASSIELLEIFRKIPLHNNVEKVAQKLREKNVKTAVVTDSYQFIADDLKKRLHFDYAFANNLIIEQGIVTGKININNSNLKRCETGVIYSICKGLVLDQLYTMLNITPAEVIAVGDGVVDIGMIKKAGLGIAYNASEQVQKNADIITNDLAVVLDYI